LRVASRGLRRTSSTPRPARLARLDPGLRPQPPAVLARREADVQARASASIIAAGKPLPQNTRQRVQMWERRPASIVIAARCRSHRKTARRQPTSGQDPVHPVDPVEWFPFSASAISYELSAVSPNRYHLPVQF